MTKNYLGGQLLNEHESYVLTYHDQAYRISLRFIKHTGDVFVFDTSPLDPPPELVTDAYGYVLLTERDFDSQAMMWEVSSNAVVLGGKSLEPGFTYLVNYPTYDITQDEFNQEVLIFLKKDGDYFKFSSYPYKPAPFFTTDANGFIAFTEQEFNDTMQWGAKRTLDKEPFFTLGGQQLKIGRYYDLRYPIQIYSTYLWKLISVKLLSVHDGEFSFSCEEELPTGIGTIVTHDEEGEILVLEEADFNKDTPVYWN